jgi:short-subunit dehydrogenase
LVTGASDGIGRAFAHRLAAEGLNIILVARRESALAAVASELQQAHGVKCRVLPADLADLQAVERVAEATSDLDVGLLVAAAGFGSSGLFLDADLCVETEMVGLNCTSVAALAWHIGPRLVQRGRGGVVFLSSLLAFHGTAYAANYAATKAYIQTLAEGLRAEWAGQGVDVIASAPGPIRSGFAARADMQMAQALPAEVVARVTLQALGRKTTVRPGWLSKLLGWSLAMLPRWGQVMVMTQVMKGMTAHQGHSPKRASA